MSATTPSPRWTYHAYRASLYRDGQRFAIVTPDAVNALTEADADALLAALNGPPEPGAGIVLTPDEVNELRFLLFNLRSPSKAQAAELVEQWKDKVTLMFRRLHPTPVPKHNVD